MPKVRTNRPKNPPVDWLKAAILARKGALSITNEALCKSAMISEPYLRKLLTQKHTREWPYDVKVRICTELGITIRTKLDVETNAVMDVFSIRQ